MASKIEEEARTYLRLVDAAKKLPAGKDARSRKAKREARQKAERFLGHLRDAVEAVENTPHRSYYITAAQTYKARDGELEIDDDATVAQISTDPPGAFVAAWVWVDAPAKSSKKP